MTVVVVFPPYYHGYRDGYAYNNGDEDANFNATHESVANSTTGEFTTLNVNTIGTYGDSSRQTVITSANMQFNFQIDFSGIARIVVSLRCGDSHVWGKLRDRSGVSNAYTRQLSELGMWIPGVIDGNSARHLLVDEDVSSDGENKTWGPYLVANPGQVVQYEFIPNNTFTAGQWTLLEIAIYDRQYGGINDMGFDGVIMNTWNITRVDVNHV